MEALTTVIRFELWLILGGLALVIAYKLLTGRINMTWLLDAVVAHWFGVEADTRCCTNFGWHKLFNVELIGHGFCIRST